MSKSSEPTQVSEGIYVYCIIESPEPRTFGKIGIGGRGDDVYTRLGPAHAGGHGP